MENVTDQTVAPDLPQVQNVMSEADRKRFDDALQWDDNERVQRRDFARERAYERLNRMGQSQSVAEPAPGLGGEPRSR